MDSDVTLHGGARRNPIDWATGSETRTPLSWYTILPGERCTPHRHTGKVETWLIVAGRGEAKLGSKVFAVRPGSALVTYPGTAHELTNLGSEPLIFVNVVTLIPGEALSTVELEG